eukprot:5459141-Prorocentrum_lima.AAC.1
MTSSLVGSEMCIRDSLLSVQYAASQESPAEALTRGWGATTYKKARLLPVSYTHLTLPTICSV